MRSPQPLNQDRAALWLGAVAFGLLAAFVLHVAMSAGIVTRDGQLGGHFQTFYGAGRVMRHDPMLLFDMDFQSAMQRDLLVKGHNPTIFPYPPLFAVAFVPLTFIPFKTAYVLAVLILAGITLLTARLLASIAHAEGWQTLASTKLVALALFAFPPMWRALVEAQTTAPALLVLVATVLVLQKQMSTGAGLVAGGLWFKPQLAALLVATLAALRQWRAVTAATASAVAVYLVTAVIWGLRWPLTWYRELLIQVDEWNRTIVIGATSSLTELIRSQISPGFGWTVTILLMAAALGWLVRLHRRTGSLTWLALALPVAAVVTAPHALYYDLGMGAPAMLAVLDRGGAGARVGLLIVLLLSTAAFLRVPTGVAAGLLLIVLIERTAQTDIEDPSTPRPAPATAESS